MFRWFRRRREYRQCVEAKADRLIEALGTDAWPTIYAESRDLDVSMRSASSPLQFGGPSNDGLASSRARIPRPAIPIGGNASFRASMLGIDDWALRPHRYDTGRMRFAIAADPGATVVSRRRIRQRAPVVPRARRAVIGTVSHVGQRCAIRPASLYSEADIRRNPRYAHMCG